MNTIENVVLKAKLVFIFKYCCNSIAENGFLSCGGFFVTFFY